MVLQAPRVLAGTLRSSPKILIGRLMVDRYGYRTASSADFSSDSESDDTDGVDGEASGMNKGLIPLLFSPRYPRRNYAGR